MRAINLDRHIQRVAQSKPLSAYGRIVNVVGLIIEATGPQMNIGDVCFVHPQQSALRIPVEVVGFRDGRILLMPLGEMHGIGPGSYLIPTNRSRKVRVGPGLLGRVIGGLGQPIDHGPPLEWEMEMPLHAAPPPPLTRRRIVDSIATGINAIDGCVTCGKGQRVAILSGSGVGKSKLIGMIARNTNADVNVIALIGERGREVRDFIELDLGEDGLKRSVVIAATSDEPALVRLSGAFAATAAAEYFRAQGADVMLMMDSVTRFAMAQREIGLAVGEPPTTKGYPPSVYALLPRLIERAGTSDKGSITGFYSVLVEADDLNDPIGDAVRSITDGHISLSRNLASRGHFPAIDILESVSRTMMEVTGENHRKLAIRFRQILSVYRDAEDLVNIGAYVAGSNPEIDSALRLMPKVRQFLRQDLFDKTQFSDIEARMTAALRG